MSNGNIYVNASSGQGGSGVMYEVDISGNIIWGPYQAATQKGFRYECDYPGILALEPFINTSTSSCFSLVNINENNSEFSVIVDKNNSLINISSEHTSFLSADILVYNMLGQEIYNQKIARNGGVFNHDLALQNIKQGIYIVKLFNNNKQLLSKKIAF
jgi:hypothetical protein